MKYVRYDKDTNEILGYYDGEIHKNIPSPNFEISEKAWQEAINTNADHVNTKTKELIVKPKETTLEDLRLAKLNELRNWAIKMTEKSAINLKGFGVIDAGYKYLLNVRAMKNNFETLPKKAFRMFDNSFKEVGLKDLERVEKAIELGGIMLHTLKWQYETAISKAESKEELESITFNEVIEIDPKDNK